MINSPSKRPNANHENQNSYTKNSKVDDDDGHYIVIPDTDLTERCEYSYSNFLGLDLTVL